MYIVQHICVSNQMRPIVEKFQGLASMYNMFKGMNQKWSKGEDLATTEKTEGEGDSKSGFTIPKQPRDNERKRSRERDRRSSDRDRGRSDRDRRGDRDRGRDRDRNR